MSRWREDDPPDAQRAAPLAFPGRVVALDVGAKRIGVATCDPSRVVTRVVGVVHTPPLDKAIQRIVQIVRDEEAVLILVGYPLTLRGEAGPQAQRIDAFVEHLRAATAVPIELYDERFTSSEARRVLEEQRPLTRQERKEGRVDELAARLLLDDYLQEQRIASRTTDHRPPTTGEA
jgi:putative holliday junction resolvase